MPQNLDIEFIKNFHYTTAVASSHRHCHDRSGFDRPNMRKYCNTRNAKILLLPVSFAGWVNHYIRLLLYRELKFWLWVSIRLHT